MADITLQQVRDKYPQYQDLSDDQLATALHQKFYSDMPEDQFRQKIGLQITPHEETYGERYKRTGEVFDKAVGTGMKGLAKTGMAAVEDVASIASGVAGDIAGAVTSVATQNPERGKKVREAMTYQPRTEGGKAGLEHFGSVVHPVTDVLSKPEQYLEKKGHPIAAQTARAVMDVAPIKVPSVLKKGAVAAREAARPFAETIAKKGEEATAIRAAEESPKNQKIAQARSIGLKLPPSEAGGPVGKTLEGISGKIQTEMEFSRANAKVINKTVGKEIGLSEKQPLTEANIERLKQKAYQPYNQIRNLGRMTFDDQYRTELESVKERTAQAQADFPEDFNESIDKEIAKFNKPSADSSSMLEKIKSLRERASKNMQAPDADKFELGIAQKKIATAMENQIERSVTDPALLKQFRDARTQLAKIYNVEDALSPNGNVSAAVLARQLKRGVPLSGGLKAIAESYMEFPKVMRYTDNLGGHAPFSALDALVGGATAVTHPGAAAKVGAALIARPVSRGILQTEAYQKAAIKPREPKPSAVSRVARKIAGPTIKDVGSPAKPTLKDVQIKSDYRQPEYTSRPVRSKSDIQKDMEKLDKQMQRIPEDADLNDPRFKKIEEQYKRLKKEMEETDK